MADVWQKPAQYCKAIILQLKISKLKKKSISSVNLMLALNFLQILYSIQFLTPSSNKKI